MPLRKRKDVETLCTFPDGTGIDVGRFVFTVDAEFEGRWFFNWPGKVVGKHGEVAVVEFMGWGNVVTRRREIPGRKLSPLTDDRFAVRLYRVSRYLSLTSTGAAIEKTPAIRVTREMEGEDDGSGEQ